MDSKPLIQSKSFWGQLVTLSPSVIGVLQLFGYATFVPLIDPVLGVISAVGSLWAMYGTVTRTTVIRGVI